MMSLIEFKEKNKKWIYPGKLANANLKKVLSRLVIPYIHIIYIIHAAPFPWLP